MNHFLSKNKDRLSFLIGMGFIAFIWIIVSNQMDNPILLPKLKDVIQSILLIVSKQANILIILSTIGRLFLSVLISFVLSIIILILYIIYPPVLSFIKPILMISKTTPVAAIIVIFLIWFGSMLSPIIITTLVIFPILLEGMIAGVKSIDRSYIEELSLNGGMNRYAITHVLMPFTYPYIFLGMIQSIGLGIKVMVMSEFISQTQTSIGNILYISKAYFQISNLFAWTFILIILVILIEYLIGMAKQKLI